MFSRQLVKLSPEFNEINASSMKINLNIKGKHYFKYKKSNDEKIELISFDQYEYS